ncbi:MAG: membrane protein insertion efficiency factor YidD [Bacteroidales bacterium]|nr:membrane protein insertion efficiency factor YidD [Bacteroidales bacterium]
MEEINKPKLEKTKPKILRQILIFPFLLPIKLYQKLISPLLPANCRHYPTCSNYSIEAFRKHGIIKGFLLASWRILRCNQWGTHGIDPVPEKLEFRRQKQIDDLAKEKEIKAN